MGSNLRLAALLFGAAMCGACGDSGSNADAGRDASVIDAVTPPDASPRDGGLDRRDATEGVDGSGIADVGEAADAAPTADAAELNDGGRADAGELADAGLGDASCAPTGPEVCDDQDNDCDGLVDNVDVGHDGITDCLRIALVGNPGLRPASNFVAWLQQQGTTVTRIHQTSTASFTPALLSSYDVVILDRLVKAYEPSDAAVLRGWIEAGGGMVVMSGYTGGAPDYDYPNSLLDTLNLRILSSLYSGPVTSFVPHATTASITSMTFQGGFNVSAIGSSTTSTASLEVARLPSGPVGIAAARGAGRIFLWGDEWIEFDSEWSSLPLVPRFWANILGWITHQR